MKAGFAETQSLPIPLVCMRGAAVFKLQHSTVFTISAEMLPGE